MVCKFKRKQSKRVSLKTKYKIKRKVQEHNRKQKKKEKKLHKKGKKDPGIPNDCPFKDQILQEVESRRKRAEELKQQQKEERRRLMEERRQKHSDMSRMVDEAVSKTRQFESAQTNEEELRKTNLLSERSLKSYCKEFRKVVEAADVVLEVLDARDPLGSRCSQVESAVLQAGADKRLVLVLNKIDLIPKENLEKWLKYLRQEMPTVAFKASTQTQRHNLSQKKNVSAERSDEGALKTSACVGADTLMKLLANYCRNRGLKTTIRVGVVGFPNVGKSSIINSLKRSRACGVGSKPGVTRTIQEVHLDKHVVLLDCPGLVLAAGSSEAAVALRNAIKVETLEDPVKPVEAILQRAGKQQLMLYYRLPDFSTVDEFLTQMARRFGKMRKGGLPDTLAAAKNLIQHWNTGKIKYFTTPPERNSGDSSESSVAFVTKMSEEFDIDSLLADEKQSFNRLLPVSTFTSITLADGGFTDGQSPPSLDEDETEMDIEKPSTSSSQTCVVSTESKKQKKEKKKQQPTRVASPVSKLEKIRARKMKCKEQQGQSDDANLTLNKDIKDGIRKSKRQSKRNEKLATKLSDKMEDALKLL